jgi:uncharacterized membrane protein YbhN (UPF0104 family)
MNEKKSMSDSTAIEAEPQITPGSPNPPAERPPGLGAKLLSPRTILSLLVAGGLLYFFTSRQDPGTLEDAWQQIRSANPSLYLAALLVYYLNFPIRALRWRILLQNAGTPADEIPRNRDLAEIIYLSWFANSIVPAKLGDLYRGWLLRREGGSSWTHAMGTIVAERMLDVIVLVTLMVLTGLAAYGDVLAQGGAGGAGACLKSGANLEDLGCTLLQLFTIGGLGVLILLIGLILVARYGAHLERHLPERLGQFYSRFAGALVLSFGQFGPLLALSLAAWTTEGLSFLLVGRALGFTIELPLVIFFSLLQAFITVIPVTPGGLGFEPILIAALSLKGYPGGAALAMTGLYRTISYLSLVVGGALVYLFSKKTK